MSDQIRVNGNIHGYGSITLKRNGKKYYGFKAAEFGDTRKRGKVAGMNKSQTYRGRTRGKYETEPGKLSGPVSTVQAFLDDIAADSADGKSFGDPEFEVTIQFVEDDDKPVTIVLEQCVIDGVKDSHDESVEAAMQELSIDYMRVTRNGKYLYSSRQ